MSTQSRRSFLLTSSGAVAGSLVVAGLAEDAGAADSAGFDFQRSGMTTGKAKPLRHRAIPGFLSAEQIAPHHTAHYGGALRGYLALDKKLQSGIRAGNSFDATAYGAMQRGRESKGNSVVLHELYFDGMTPKRPAPKAEIRKAIESRFGSIEKWAADFQMSAKSAAGWAMLVRHPVNGRLYNLVSDEHAHGALWMSAPLVVIDVYEHAFYIDYKNRKGDYVAKFLSHIDWEAANARYRASLK